MRDALATSPTTFKQAAGGSTIQPIVAIIGNASNGKLYNETISISPINPPPGIPDITTPDNTEIKIAIRYVSIPVKLLPNTPNKKAIFRIDAILDPSICIVAPIGSVVLATSSSIPSSVAHSKFDGRLASEEQVPSDVTVGVKALLKNSLTPLFFLYI